MRRNATCSESGAKNADFVHSLGADQVIDYTRADFSTAVKDIDLVFDLIGGDVRFKSFPVLKPGGVLGLTDHRAKVGGPTDAKTIGDTGYVPEAFLIAQVEAAGFKLSGKSEINANPKDTKDYPKGVWTLPPSYELKDVDHAKYQAIGESDRMTLKFVKP